MERLAAPRHRRQRRAPRGTRSPASRDPAGRLLWAALGDPALLPRSRQGALHRQPRAALQGIEDAGEVPPDALVPSRAGRSAARAPGSTARTKLVYRVLPSNFSRRSRMTAADRSIRTPSPRAGAQRRARRTTPRSSARPRRAREGCRGPDAARGHGGPRPQRSQFLYVVAVVEVYLKTSGRTHARRRRWRRRGARCPWQVLALMEEAVGRGVGAFSDAEAKRRGVRWLDLARDAKTGAALGALVADFARRAWVPEALRGLVTADQARQRWAALAQFPQKTRPLPRDQRALPAGEVDGGLGDPARVPRLHLSAGRGLLRSVRHPAARLRPGGRSQGRSARDPGRCGICREAGRSYKLLREPFTPGPAGESTREPLTVHWMMVGAGDEVVAAGPRATFRAGGCIVDLAGAEARRLPRSCWRWRSTTTS